MVLAWINEDGMRRLGLLHEQRAANHVLLFVNPECGEGDPKGNHGLHDPRIPGKNPKDICLGIWYWYCVDLGIGF